MQHLLQILYLVCAWISYLDHLSAVLLLRSIKRRARLVDLTLLLLEVLLGGVLAEFGDLRGFTFLVLQTYPLLKLVLSLSLF